MLIRQKYFVHMQIKPQDLHLIFSSSLIKNNRF